MTLRIVLLWSIALVSYATLLPPPKGVETIPLSKTAFKQYQHHKEHIIRLRGEDFIVVSVREPGSDGRFYAVDRDGTVWWSGTITSGASAFRSPSGIFRILKKKRYHMSMAYPDEKGINNMDYMMQFTKQGHALHKGSTKWLSHGCIHIDPKDIPVLYRWSHVGMRVVITRESYMPFARDDLMRLGF